LAFFLGDSSLFNDADDEPCTTSPLVVLLKLVEGKKDGEADGG